MSCESPIQHRSSGTGILHIRNSSPTTRCLPCGTVETRTCWCWATSPAMSAEALKCLPSRCLLEHYGLLFYPGRSNFNHAPFFATPTSRTRTVTTDPVVPSKHSYSVEVLVTNTICGASLPHPFPVVGVLVTVETLSCVYTCRVHCAHCTPHTSESLAE